MQPFQQQQMNNTLKNIFKFFTISLVLGLSFSCEEERPEEKQTTCDFSQEEMFVDYGALVVNNFSQLGDKLDELESAATNLKPELNDQNIADLKNKLNEAYLAYQSCSMFDFGPGSINGLPYTERFDTYPTNQSLVKDNAKAGVTDVNSLFKSQVGFPALEFLIYAADTVFTEGRNSLSEDLIHQHLLALIGDMKLKTNELLNEWKSSYATSFASNTGTADGSSLSLLANAFVFDFEARLRNIKLRIPAGYFSAGPQPEKGSAYFSDNGFTVLSTQFASLKALYGESENSFSAYLKCLGETQLDSDIQAQFSSIESQLNAISQENLTDLFIAEDNRIIELVNECQKMIPLLKGSMINAFGVRISYTDSDGD